MIKRGCALLGAIIMVGTLLAGLSAPVMAGAYPEVEIQAEGYQVAVIQEDRCTPDQPGCLEYHRFVQGICIPGFFLSDPGFPWILGPCPGAPTATATEPVVIQPTATNTAVGTEPPVETEPPSSTEDPGTDPTQAVLPTARPNPPRQQPGGPGNLGLVIAGVLVVGGVTGLSALFILRKRTLR